MMPLKATLTCDPLLVNWGAPDQQRAEQCSICDTALGDFDTPLIIGDTRGWLAFICPECTQMHVVMENVMPNEPNPWKLVADEPPPQGMLVDLGREPFEVWDTAHFYPNESWNLEGLYWRYATGPER